MIRKGRFALWQSKEYELISYQRKYYLRSEDQSDSNKGFIKMNGNNGPLIKHVSINELDDAFEIIPYAMLSGHRFEVEGYNKEMDTIALVTNNPFVKNKIEVRPYGKYEYIIEIPSTTMKIEEDRIHILGFENKFN